MTTQFRVGQRVRIRWSIGYPELAGEEGVIVGRDTSNSGPLAGFQGWAVAPDCWGSSTGPDGDCFTPINEQLEPIQDRNTKIGWRDCLWLPEHLRVTP